MNIRTSFTLLVSLVFVAHESAAQGTAFTYQGRMNDGVNPAGGQYDLQFILFGVNQFGFPVGPILTNANVPVSNGLFTVTLDFGAGAFPGADRWLEIGVRTNGNGNFATLVPRQQLASTPYAITAGSVASGAGLSGTYGAAVTFSNANNNFSGSFNGNGANVSNVNAVTLGGSSASNFWKTSGNAGTTAGTNFLGTTDNQSLELRVNGQRALRFEPGGSNSVNVIGGNAVNSLATGIAGATVSGGGAGNYFGMAYTNRADAHFATVAGGGNNTIQGGSTASTVSGGRGNIVQSNATDSAIGGGNDNVIGPSAIQSTISGGGDNSILRLQATIGGGFGNKIGGTNFTLNYDPFINFGQESTIGGGGYNYISGELGGTIAGGVNNLIFGGLYSTIAGGQNNIVTNRSGASWSFVGGGKRNLAYGDYATVPGGTLNTAGPLSFAAGNRAKATNSGTFVWADSQNADFGSTSNNQFLVRAAGGVGINTTNPAATLDVNGSLRVGSGGSVFANLQGGVAQMATDSTTVKTNFTFSFPRAFASVPNVLVSARSASDVDDTFSVTVRRVTTTTCTVNVVRTDVAAGWGQHVQVTWTAWE